MEVGIENIMTDILDLGGLQVGRYITNKLHQSGKSSFK